MGNCSKLLSEIGEYNMNTKRLGKAYIFNNKNFNRHSQRVGTEVDQKNLEELFKKLGLKTKIYNDLDQIGLLTKLKKISKSDFSDDACFLAVFLSHGKEDRIMMKDHEVREEAIYDYFKGEECTSLVNKPKIFILQTCRGNAYQMGTEDADTGPISPNCDHKHAVNTSPDDDVSCDSDGDLIGDIIEADGSFSSTPSGADFIKCYPTTQGYVSFRNRKNGSWFIQNIVEVFTEYIQDETDDKLDFTTLMKVVANRVARKTSCLEKESLSADYKQMPCTVTTLKKRIFFRKLIDSEIYLH